MRQKGPEFLIIVERLQETIDVTGAAEIYQSNRVKVLFVSLWFWLA